MPVRHTNGIIEIKGFAIFLSQKAKRHDSHQSTVSVRHNVLRAAVNRLLSIAIVLDGMHRTLSRTETAPGAGKFSHQEPFHEVLHDGVKIHPL